MGGAHPFRCPLVDAARPLVSVAHCQSAGTRMYVQRTGLIQGIKCVSAAGALTKAASRCPGEVFGNVIHKCYHLSVINFISLNQLSLVLIFTICRAVKNWLQKYDEYCRSSTSN